MVFIFAILMIPVIILTISVTSSFLFKFTERFAIERTRSFSTVLKLLIQGLKLSSVNAHVNRIIDDKPFKEKDIYTYERDTVLFDKGVTPVVAFMLLQGRIDLYQGKRRIGSLKPSYLLGISEIIQNLPCNYKAVIREGSEVLAITKTELIRGSDLCSSEMGVKRLMTA